jgi:thiamine biosynthesis lipoprotein
MSATVITEQRETFACFGSQCTVAVYSADRPADAAEAVAMARRNLQHWHHQFSRFQSDSELSRLNADPRPTVEVSPMMRRVVQAAVDAARRSGGLVDPTLGADIVRSGYGSHFSGDGLPLDVALALAPSRAPAAPRRGSAWSAIDVSRSTGTVTRPPGIELDISGIAKGVFADELAALLAGYDAFAVDCCGDIRLGGRARERREVHVASPFDESSLHTFELEAGGVATSGIGKRSWLGPDAEPGHHLLDPRTGRPAFTGVVQVTAVAPTAGEAEVLSKAALLSGPTEAARWLVSGGVIVLEDGSWRVVER